MLPPGRHSILERITHGQIDLRPIDARSGVR
jgi:hypothetical protein